MVRPALARVAFSARHASASIAALVAVILSTASHAAGTEVAPAAGLDVRVVPGTVLLEVGDSAVVELVIRNPATSAADLISVDVRAPTRIRSEVPSVLPERIPAGGSVRIPLRLSARPGFDSGEAAVLAGYQLLGSPGGRQAGTASVTLSAGKASATPQLLFVNAPAKLGDGQQRDALVRISNTSPFVFRDLALSSLDGDDVELRISEDSPLPRPFAPCEDRRRRSVSPGPALACLDRLRPGATRVLGIQLTADESVRTGKQRVGVALAGDRSTSPDGVVIPAFTVIETADIELSVFGVDALSPFPVGTLFLLPGLLAVIVFLLLGRWVYPRSPKLPETVGLTDLRALPVVAPLALLAYVLMWLVLGRNLTESVGTTDVVLLFALGLTFGVVVWVIMSGVWYRRIGRKQFSIEDKLETVLKRLKANETGLVLPVVTHGKLNYLLLGFGQDGTALVAPPLTFTYTGKATAAQRVSFRTAVEDNDTGAVIEASRRGVVSLNWKVPTGVVAVKAEEVGALTETKRLLEEAEAPTRT
jgi:hypothetical protein